jgi:hypothetical protein
MKLHYYCMLLYVTSSLSVFLSGRKSGYSDLIRYVNFLVSLNPIQPDQMKLRFLVRDEHLYLYSYVITYTMEL